MCVLGKYSYTYVQIENTILVLKFYLDAILYYKYLPFSHLQDIELKSKNTVHLCKSKKEKKKSSLKGNCFVFITEKYFRYAV